MTTITIKNVGPIRRIENLELNKINVFMGPQSSGKSTIAKIVSFCTYVEKDVATNQSLDDYNTNGNFRKKLEEFHRLGGYFRDDESEICYESNVIKLQFKNNRCVIEWKDKYAYKRSKIEYFPSERNLITLPFIQKVEMPNSNNRSFLFDWLTIRGQYNKTNSVKILDLPIAYYFDESTGENHIVSMDENDRYDILLENASSGLQSLIPLIIVSKYLTEWIYENEEEISFEKRSKMTRAISLLIDELVLSAYYGKIFSGEERISKITELNTLLSNENPEVTFLFNKWKEIAEGIKSTHNTQLIIEEPEQNLFPSAQRDLIYHLLKLLDFERGDRVSLTTHSPYILYALNNCMMGYLVKNQLDGDERGEYLKTGFLSERSWIDPKSVSIWEIEDGGTLKNIQDKDNIVAENYFDQKMTELTDEYYQMLNYYKNEE